MKHLCLGVLACLSIALAGCGKKSGGRGGGDSSGGSSSGGSTGSNADKIIGAWKIVKADGKEPPREAADNIMEFTKDGKVWLFGVEYGGGEAGNYKVDGDKLTVSKGDQKPPASTIKNLTADSLILVDTTGGRTVEIELKKIIRTNAEKIIGTWRMVKANGQEAPKGTGDLTMEFTKYGKVKMIGGEFRGGDEANYKVDGDKLIVSKGEQNPPASTIKTLTVDSLVLVNTSNGKSSEIEMKRK